MPHIGFYIWTQCSICVSQFMCLLQCYIISIHSPYEKSLYVDPRIVGQHAMCDMHAAQVSIGIGRCPRLNDFDHLGLQCLFMHYFADCIAFDEYIAGQYTLHGSIHFMAFLCTYSDILCCFDELGIGLFSCLSIAIERLFNYRGFFRSLPLIDQA